MVLNGKKRKRSEVKNGKVSSSKKFKKLNKKRKEKSFFKRQADKGDGSNVTATWQKKIGRSVAKEGRPKKKVVVSRELRKKIKKVLDKDACVGWFKEVNYNLSAIIPIDNGQTVAHLATGATAGLYALPFSPNQVLNAASILFNGKTPGFFLGGVNSAPVVGDFDITTLKVHVIESSMVYHMKNNTQRTLHMKIYDISPKSAVSPPFDPLANSWADPGLNVLSNVNTDLYVSPKTSSYFTKMFSIDETVVILEAGKEYHHKVPGPKDMLYDFAKFKIAGETYSPMQKMVKLSFVVFMTDLAGGATGVGRISDIAGGGYGLIVEAVAFTRLKMPEQTGLVVPALPVSGPLPLGSRKSTYGIKVWTDAATSPIVVVQDEDPMGPVSAAP